MHAVPIRLYVIGWSNSSFLCVLYSTFVFPPIAWNVINNQWFPFLFFLIPGSSFSSLAGRANMFGSAQQELFSLVFFLSYWRPFLVPLFFSVTASSRSFLSMVRDCWLKPLVGIHVTSWYMPEGWKVEEDYYLSQGKKQQELVNRYKHLPVFAFHGGFTLWLRAFFHSLWDFESFCFSLKTSILFNSF